VVAGLPPPNLHGLSPHPTTGESLYIERPVSMLSQQVAHLLQGVKPPQEDVASSEFCGFLRYM